MAAKIKLARFGKKGDPTYRIVIADESERRQGRVVVQLGYYNPAAKTDKVHVDMAEIKKWISKGAQPTDGIKKLLGL
jgi:small subunit ribosomal protein S16